MSVLVGIYGVDTSTAIWNVEVCLSWVNQTGCPHATQQLRDANHLHKLIDTHGRGEFFEDYIENVVLTEAAATVLKTEPVQNTLVGRFRTVIP